MSEPQRALISTISAGQDAIDSASSLLNEKAKLPPLGNDPASVKWKETQWNTNQQAVHSQVSAMNAATAQMVTLTGQDSTDHNAVGAAVNTISTNLPDMAREVKMLAALMDDKGVEGDDLMGAAKTLCGAFSDMLSSAAPQTTEVSTKSCKPVGFNCKLHWHCFLRLVKINHNCVILLVKKPLQKFYQNFNLHFNLFTLIKKNNDSLGFWIIYIHKYLNI